MKKLLKLLFSRATLLFAVLLVQAAVLFLTVYRFSKSYVYVYALFTVVAVAAVVHIVSCKDNPAYKLAWSIVVLIFPIFGITLYCLFGGSGVTKRFTRKMAEIEARQSPFLKQSAGERLAFESLGEKDGDVRAQAEYITRSTGFPVCINTYSQYLPSGEQMHARHLEEIKKAKRYVFLEYFIIEEGKMWNETLEVLLQKQREGVDVRVMYDDMGCIMTLKKGYDAFLRQNGIKCVRCNPVKPFLTGKTNNRDHRKITVIDGHTAFTGGVNLADEYINAVEKHGHWKDAAVILKGHAAFNFTLLFLQMWEYHTGERENPAAFIPKENEFPKECEGGLALPFGDSPYDGEEVAARAFMNIISRATEYVYINTPYLIIDNETVTALIVAAKSGVDVRIVCPGVADKGFVHETTRSYYDTLVENGVKIYEYTPGFIHAKTIVSDDKTAIVGTINMDYRSLYLHFECGVWFAHAPVVKQVKEEFLQTLSLCQKIEKGQKVSPFRRVLRQFLRLFAPLM